nr:DegT/DnrJ/EryC1/StrS family aminotransferase [uncultured Desulfobacter sp.]
MTKYKPFRKPIYVTKPFLPALNDFKEGLNEIWDNKWLTNNGPILQRFNNDLCSYFKTRNICLFTNGTLALQIGLQGMELTGEVITTPFTFVATAHVLHWNRLKPIFVDIEPEFYTLDAEKVEAAITNKTTAILAVHVYGHPCNLTALADIARRHNLKLIYDAAHAFGVTVSDKSIADYGDMSMFSLHATKLYHSIEGGMLTFQDPGMKKISDYLKNFGFENEVEVVMPGTNAKMNEFQALMGILILKHIDDIIEKRKKITNIYQERLKSVPGIHLRPELPHTIHYNYAYLPIEVHKKEFGMSRNMLYEKLKGYNIFTRRYFYPLICDFTCYKTIAIKDPLTVARRAADRILTLPIYYDLALLDAEKICDIIIDIGSNG